MNIKPLLLLLGVLSALPTLARDFKYTYEGQTITYTVIDEDAKTCMTKEGYSSSNEGYYYGNKASGDLILPEHPKDGNVNYTLTQISNLAFIGNVTLSSLVIPNSVTTIGDGAFLVCINLKSVEIPNSVTSIGAGAFGWCSGLTSFVIPDSITEIGEGAFFYCTGLTSLVIPDSIETIEDSTFCGCSGLTSLVIPNSVTSIGAGAFGWCSVLTSFMIPNSVTSIGAGAFGGCSGLTSFVIPNSVTEIKEKTFSDCTALTEIIIGNSVVSIREGAFKGCTGLTSFVIPNSVTEIKEETFSGCTALTEITIGNSVASIGKNAFFNCTGLTSVVIPNSVTSIEESAFIYCVLDSLMIGYGIEYIGRGAFNNSPNNIYITAQTPPEIQSDTFGSYSGITLYLQGKDAVQAYRNDDKWAGFHIELLIEPTAMMTEGTTSFSGNVGDTFQCNANLAPENVSLPYVLWSSTNPEVATVDSNGLVTLQKYSSEDITRADGENDNDGICKIIAESLYFGGPIAEFTIKNSNISAVETVTVDNSNSIDYTLPYDVYNMNGMKVSDSTEGLPSGIFIIRQGKVVVKTVIR